MSYDELKLQRIHENVEWLIDGNVPTVTAVRRSGWEFSIEALIKAFNKIGLPVNPKLQHEYYWEKHRKKASA